MAVEGGELRRRASGGVAARPDGRARPDAWVALEAAACDAGVTVAQLLAQAWLTLAAESTQAGGGPVFAEAALATMGGTGAASSSSRAAWRAPRPR